MTRFEGGSQRPTVRFIVESGTDARLVEGLAARVPLSVLARAIPGGRAISQPTQVPAEIAGAGRLAFAWLVLRRLITARSSDVVLVQGYGIAALAANVAARLRGARCWMLVCSPVAEYYETRRAAGQPFSAVTLAGINLIARLNGILGRGYVVLSEYLEQVVRRYSRHARVEIVPVYGVDTRRFAPLTDRARARVRRGLPATGGIIFSSSRVAPEKDTSTLIEAFAMLVREGRDVHLLHRSGGYREFLAHAGQSGVGARTIATDASDPRGDLALDYMAADVAVQASRAEGLGFSVLEALACGTPVVASAVGGLVETVRDGMTGWSVPPGDPEGLAAALRDVLDRPDEAQRRGAAGAMAVRQRFRSDEVFDRLASLLLTDE
ncbi:MAG: glycosyltransferase family 4 protein [Burkholderiales bacterium]